LLIDSGSIALSWTRFALVTASTAWPAILSVILIGGVTRRQRSLFFLLALVGYGIAGISGSVVGSRQAIVETAELWLSLNLPTTLVIGSFLLRPVRQIGPSVFLVMVGAVGGAGVVLQLLQAVPGLAFIAANALSGALRYAVPASLGVLLGAAFAFALFKLLALAYSRHFLGDDQLTLNAIWLVYCGWFSVLLSESRLLTVASLGCFALWLTLSSLAARMMRGLTPVPGPQLLLLRVFTDDQPTLALFASLSRFWRNVGPIAMISWKDLGSDVIEPGELMAFVRRDLRRVFVESPAASLAQLDRTSQWRDPDGRYRIQHRLCFNNTWLPTVQGMIERSALVVIDLCPLRGKLEAQEDIARRQGQTFDFDAGVAKSGIGTELQELRHRNGLGRTLLIHDGTGLMEKVLAANNIPENAVAAYELKPGVPFDPYPLIKKLADRCMRTSGLRSHRLTAEV